MPGDLLGPFDGKAVDAVSGKPIAGAIVQVSWSFETGRGLTAPAGGHVQTIATDNEGKYEIDRLSDVPTSRRRITGVAIVIYQRGYVAYRSDRVFDNALGGARARHDFSQRNNVAKMERWSGAYSHVKHVRFVGGTTTLKRALGSEVVEASLELTAGRVSATPAAEPEGIAPLDASPLLSIDELRAVTGYNGAFTVEKLGDLPTSGTYDSRHFKATGRTETYDAALRVWKTTPTAAEARYAKLLAEVPHAESKDEMGDRSLRGYDGRIVAIGVLDRAHGVVIELTCGLDQCRDADQAAALLRRVLARADKLEGNRPPTSETPAADEKQPEEKAPEKEPEPTKTEPPPAEDKPFQLKRPEMKR